MGGLVDLDDWQDVVSMCPFAYQRRSDRVGAIDQLQGSKLCLRVTLWLTIAGLLSGCAGARYERGVSAFDAADAPVHMVSAEAPSPDLVSAHVTVRAGSAHDPTGYAGVAWATAHAVSERGEAVLDAVDGQITVHVGKELVSFHLEAPATAEASLTGALRDMFDLSSLEDSDLEDRRAAGVKWLTEGLATDAGRLADAAFERWVFEGHPYALPVQGRASGLSRVDARTVQRFKAERYIRPSLSVEVRGAKQPEAIQAALSTAPSKLYVDVTPRPVSPVKSHEVLLVVHELSSTGLVLGHPLHLRPGHEDWTALMFGLSALSADPGAAMAELLSREDAVFRMRLMSAEPRAGAALFDSGMSRASSFVSNGLSQERFTTTQSALTSSLASTTTFGMRSRARLMGRPTPADLADRIRKLTLEQVNAALAKHIDPGALRVVMTGRADAFDGLTFETAHRVDGADLFE